MDTIQFLDRVLPTTGNYVLALQIPNYSGMAHRTYETIEKLAKAVKDADNNPNISAVYFACASYRDPVGPAKKGLAKRNQENSYAIRAQWIDIDIGPDKPYQSQKEALIALRSFCSQFRLQMPLIVSSGGGLHCYWPFTRDLPTKKIKPHMEQFVLACKAHGFKHDYTCAADTARILRPVGSTWRKDGEREVRVLRDTEPMDYRAFYGKFAAFTSKAPAPSAPPADDEWSTGPKTYPPSSAHEIVKRCPTIAAVANVQGNVEEPLWRSMLGVLKHTVEGVEVAHEWSSGHPRYNAQETQEKFDRWSGGPTTCQQFERLSELCEGCPHKAKKSPIHLGYIEEEPAPAKVYEPMSMFTSSYAKLEPDALPFWPEKKYRYNGKVLEKFFPGNPEDSDSVPEWKPILSALVYPFMRFEREEDGERMLKVCALISKKHNRWHVFDMPSKVLADNRMFAQALAAHEVYVQGDKMAIHARAFFQDVVHQQQDMNMETRSFEHFGWQKDGQFVIGTRALWASKVEPVFLGEKIPRELNKDFGKTGTAQRWAEIIDEVYNRKGAEAYQFAICAGFGAPLVKLVESDLWKGIPIAFTGQGGLGKTTAAMVATSMYGKPGNMVVTASEVGTTMNALIQRISTMKHLPLVLDEITGRQPEELKSLLYALANGKPKTRVNQQGKIIDNGENWSTISFVTGNQNITGLLSQLDSVTADATKLRCFEIVIDQESHHETFKGVNAKRLIENELLRNNCGEAGEVYLQYVMKHRSVIADKLSKARQKIAKVKSGDTSRERFYYDVLATALVAGTIAKKLGLIDFDMDAIKKWGMEHILTLRRGREEDAVTPHDQLGRLLDSLTGRTVHTEHFSPRVGRSQTQAYVDTKMLRGDPVARVASKDKRILIKASYVREWCADNRIHYNQFMDDIREYVVPTVANRISIWSGTNLPTLAIRCVELTYDALIDTRNDLGVALGTVTDMEEFKSRRQEA